MKIFVCLIALVPLCLGSAILEPIVVKQNKVTTGVSSQYRAQDNQGNYEFAYDESHATGGSFRKEAGSAHGPVIGSYGLRDIDGRVRVVNYVADDAGFRAAIATNEPGIVPKAPAAVSITKPEAAVVAPTAEVIVPAPAISTPVVASPAVVASAAVASPIEQVIDGHSLGINSPLVASIAPKIIAARPLAYTGSIAAAPISSIAPAHHAAPISSIVAQEAPIAQVAQIAQYAPVTNAVSISANDALIRNYATSIYGPSLLSGPSSLASTVIAASQAPIVATAPAAPLIAKQQLYQPPLQVPAVQYLQSEPIATDISPIAAKSAPVYETEAGYYEPSMAYAHPNSWGYTLGLPSTWGYQLVYRRKK